MWLKYANAPIDKSTLVYRNQSDRVSSYNKPAGFWITDSTEQCWRSWCVSERFSLESLTHKHIVTLDESGILILRNPYDLDDFTKRFRIDNWWGGEDNRKYCDKCINWKEVAKAHTGLIITPYQWERRMSDDYSWYYGWDCSSGCIWDASAILDVALIEVDQDVAKPRESEAA